MMTIQIAITTIGPSNNKVLGQDIHKIKEVVLHHNLFNFITEVLIIELPAWYT